MLEKHKEKEKLQDMPLYCAFTCYFRFAPVYEALLLSPSNQEFIGMCLIHRFK